MNIDSSKLEVIGIDRIVLSNFNIKNFEQLERKEITNKFEYIERFEIKEKAFHLVFSKNLKDSGEIYSYATLEFNANKIVNEHNIYNSSQAEVYNCLNQILKVLKNAGVDIDISEAKIRELEINITLDKSYSELNEVILLLLRANYKKALGLYSATDSNIPDKIKRDRSIYINSKLDTKKDITGKVIKIYDKTFEMLYRNNLFLDRELTRVEVLFGRDYYRNIMEKINCDNSLKTFLEVDILKKIFYEALEQELKVKPIKQLEIIKANLTKDFNNFRRNEKNKRIERMKLKKLSKNIPEYLKEERGVFEYLKRESWVFDYSFLLDIVKNNVISKHQKDYENQIKKKYLSIKNKQIYENFLNSIFFTD